MKNLFPLFPVHAEAALQDNAIAQVSIEPRYSLAETAERLGALLEVPFVPTQRFDEFPAYLGEKQGLEFALLGPPPSEVEIRSVPTDWLELQIQRSPTWLTRAPMIDFSRHCAAQLQVALGVACLPLEMKGGGSRPWTEE